MVPKRAAFVPTLSSAMKRKERKRIKKEGKLYDSWRDYVFIPEIDQETQE
jgi:hypothetical protein